MVDKLALKLPGGNRIDPIMGMPSGGDETLLSAISNGFTWLFVILTLTALIFFIWGGISWITSQGDKSKVEAARKRIVYALIGLIVGFASYFIINIISTFFGVRLYETSAPGRSCVRDSNCGRPTQWECVNNRCREK